MDVSVIITAYNIERYIRRAIDSALNQEGLAVEVIVVDDCSRDGTWNVISALTDPRLKKIRLDSNAGPGGARNTAIASATGEWIAVLDGDDELVAGRLARCLQTAKLKQADIVVDNLLVCREMDRAEFPMFPPKELEKRPLLDAATFIKGTLSNKNTYTLGYVKPIFSRRFLQQHQLSYDPTLNIGEDYQLMVEALLAGACCAVEPAAGYRYTVRTSSISHRLSLLDITRMMEADSQLMNRYTLDNAATLAQAGRTRWLKREYAFAQLVAAIKQKNGRSALKAIASDPSCVWLLRHALQVRIQRLVS